MADVRSTSVVIPAFNEADVVGRVVRGLRDVGAWHEILVVDDGSTDQTAEEAERAGARVVRHPYNNKGNGAAVKTGIRHASGEFLLILDADGQHRPEDAPRGQKSWDAGLSGTKRDYPGQNPGVCCGFWEAPRPDGDQDFCPAVFPHSAILEGVGDGFDPWKSVFEGPCGSHHQHNSGHDPGPDSTVIELVALLRAQPFSKQHGRRGIRERSDATLLRGVHGPRGRAPSRDRWALGVQL